MPTFGGFAAVVDEGEEGDTFGGEKLGEGVYGLIDGVGAGPVDDAGVGRGGGVRHGCSPRGVIGEQDN